MSEPKITISLTSEQARDVENALVIRAIQLTQRGCAKKAREIGALSNKVYDLRKRGEGEAPTGGLKKWLAQAWALEPRLPSFLAGLAAGMILSAQIWTILK